MPISSLPQTATGYYLDSTGLPVLTGETKISIEGWGDEDYRDYDADSTIQVALDEGLLNTDSATASFPRMDGEDYAIVPISMQVLYPANGGSAEVVEEKEVDPDTLLTTMGLAAGSVVLVLLASLAL